MFTVLLRGNTAELDVDPNAKDDVLLAEFANALVGAQLRPLGIQP